MEYTRITPDGEEKCSLRNGDGMTIEEMRKKLRKYCINEKRSVGCSSACLLYNFNCYATQDMQANFLSKGHISQIEEAYALITAPNFVKANPDEEVASEGDAVESGLADSGTRREFASGAVRDVAEGKGRCDLLPAVAILRLARHFERGAIKYSDRNWEKGIPIHSFIDSAIRHTMKYLDGQHDEDHLCAAAWNLICAMWTEEKHPELNDLPWAKEGNR